MVVSGFREVDSVESVPVRVELIEGRTAITALRSQWQSVYRADPEANYFLSFEWLFGTAEGAGRGGFVLAARTTEGNADFVAFLPIRLNTEHDDGRFHNELNLCGNYNSDYTGFICLPEFEDAAIPALAARLGRMHWRRLRLLNFAASDRRTRLFMQAFSSEVLTLRHLKMLNPDGTDNGICPHATLSGDWDDFLARYVSANTRQKIRRYLRQVEGSDAYRFTQTTPETFDRDAETLIRLWSKKWGQNKGKRLGSIQMSIRRMLRNALETGTLFMPILWHDDRPICMLAILVDDRKKAYNFYIGARDETFEGPPAGLVLHSYSIRHAISQGVTKYDFLRGNEPYKYAFGAKEARIRSLLVSTKSGRNLGDRLDPRCTTYVRQRAAEFYRAGELSFAKGGHEQLLEMDPDNISLRYMQGLTATRLGDTETACRAFRTCLENEPDSLKTWVRLGRALIAESGTWNDAAQSHYALLRTVSDQRQVPYLLGRVLLRLGQADFAAAILESALRRRPDDTALRAALAHARKVRGDSASTGAESLAGHRTGDPGKGGTALPSTSARSGSGAKIDAPLQVGG
jgi:CelD/BcsL family acetyltransferase involved in cellulose biosynthesis